MQEMARYIGTYLTHAGCLHILGSERGVGHYFHGEVRWAHPTPLIGRGAEVLPPPGDWQMATCQSPGRGRTSGVPWPIRGMVGAYNSSAEIDRWPSVNLQAETEFPGPLSQPPPPPPCPFPYAPGCQGFPFFLICSWLPSLPPLAHCNFLAFSQSPCFFAGTGIFQGGLTKFVVSVKTMKLWI